MWPENWPAVELFVRCQTQWRIGPNGLVGMDYGSLIEMASLYQMPDLPAVMEAVQIIEAEILMQQSKEAR